MQLIMKKKWVKMRQQRKSLEKAESCAFDYCFPNKLDDIAVLTFAIENGCKKKAPYYLGNLFYDKLQWKKSVELWEMSKKADDTFSIVLRTLHWLITTRWVILRQLSVN